MADPQQKTQDDFSPIPKPEFSVRTGQPLSDIDLSQSETSVKVPVKAAAKQPSTSTPKRGMFLVNRLNKLYTDPLYKNGDETVKQYYKDKAYDKWVVPYYKHIGENAPTREEFLSGQHKSSNSKLGWYQGIVDKAPGMGYAALKETSKITGGLAGLMSYAGAGIDWIAGSDVDEKQGGLKKAGTNDKNLETHLKDVQVYFKTKEDYYDKQLEASNDGHASTWRDNPEQKTAQLVTQGVFFEATGAGKAAKLFQVANPRTAAMLVKMVKSSWNTAVGFGLWSASQGDTPQDIKSSAETGAVLGPLGALGKKITGLDKFHDMLTTMFKYGGAESAKPIINDAVGKAATGHGKELVQQYLEEPMSKAELQTKIEDLLKSVQATEIANKNKGVGGLTPESSIGSSAIAVRLHEMSQDKYTKTFDKLSWIQQRGIINKFLSTDTLGAKLRAEAQPPSAEVLHTMVKEQQDKLNQATPVAAEVDKKVGEFVKSNGNKPEVLKIKATMPHHNTTVDSPWKDIQARTSFLKSQLRRYKQGTPEHKELQEAINEEYSLMQEKANKQIDPNRSKPGGALINDMNAFKGDELLVRPASPGDRQIFAEWRNDKIAGQVHEQITKSSPVGAMDRKAQAIMTSFQAGSMLEVFAKDRFQDTVVLHHNQYGPIGGANYSVIGTGKDKTLMLNWISLRPNVVAKAFDTPGAGQALFLSVLEKARAANAGVELHSAPSAANFYTKMGMTGDDNNNFKMSSEQVKQMLAQKGLIAALLAAGIGGYAVTKEQQYEDVTVIPKENK